MSTPTSLPVGNRTDITTPEQISFCGSPVHLKIQNAAKDSTIQSAFVYLWVWNGAQNKPLGRPNRTLFKRQVSASDNYINFEIADYVKAFLERPDNAPNTNQPNFAYNEATPAAITGQGVFYHVEVEITSSTGVENQNLGSFFATIGWRWNYEQNSIGNNGLSPDGSVGYLTNVNRWYNEKIPNYFTQSFNLTTTVATATASNVITRTPVTPPSEWTRCSLDGALIVFINKLGLWEQFSPHGKITSSSKIESETQNKSFRDPGNIDNTYTHSKLRSNLDVTQMWNINTGSLTEDMINKVEQILYSPKVYLIKFNNTYQEQVTQGVTIDSTFVTIDNTNITIDSATISQELQGYYKGFEQIPVIVTDSDFTRKTRLNDKNKIDYNIKFEETNNKILDIR